MQTAEKTSAAKLNDLSSAISVAAADLARYPALAVHATRFEAVAHDLLLPPLVVVMGAFNAGKSTLLNALLGRDLLNMHVLPATATVTMLRKGMTGEVFGHAKGVATRTWPLSELTSLSAEGDADSATIRQSLSFVEVPLEHPLLDRVTLVDTPGLNSPNETHTRATEDFVHRAQAVLWIVSCLQPLNEQERSWIERLPAGIKVLVVVNQIDQLDPEEDSLPRLIERVKNNLQRPDVSVTAVSAKLALESFLKSDRTLLSESLWETFFSSMQREIIEGDAGLRVQRAVRDVLSLVESLNEKIESELLEVEGYRLQARGGNDYHEDLQQRIQSLSEAEHQLVHSRDAIASIQVLEIPDDWEVSEDTRLKHQVLIGAVLAFTSEQSTLDHESTSLNERFQNYSNEVRQLEADIEAYNKSGLFGGAPVIFDGKKKKLEARGLRLNTRNAALQNEQNALYAELRSLTERRNRTKGDCASFIEHIIGAIRGTMVSVVKESHDTVGHQKIAAAKLADFKWLQDFASKVQGKSLWSLQERMKPLSVDEADMAELGANFDRLALMIDNLRTDGWAVSVPTPLALPSPSQRLLPQADPLPIVRVRQGAIAKSLLVAAAIAVLIIFILIARRSTPPPVTSVPVVDIQQQKPTASVPLPPVVDDYEAIRAALLNERYTADGAMTDVPGLIPDSILHVQRVSCNRSEESCEKLFVFAGARAVWSEDLPSSASFSDVTATGPGQFSAQVKNQLPDSSEGFRTVSYKWDGSSLSRTDSAEIAPSANPTETASEENSGSDTTAIPSSPNVPVESPPTADTENQRGIAFANSRQYDMAIAAFNRGLQLNPGRADLYNNRGAMFANKGDARRAIADYDQAIRLNSNYAEALGNRGNAYSQLGDYDHAIADYDRALALNPNLTWAVGNRRSAALKQAQQSQAVQPYNLQNSVAPSSGNFYSAPIVRSPPSAYAPRSVQGASYNEVIQSAQTALQRKDLRGAYRLATQARDLEPNSLPALELIQIILAAGGDPAQAESAALEAIKHGGKAVFELQHFHAWPIGLHAARLVITSGTLEFVPEAACKYGTFTIPLSTIKSVEIGQNTFNAYLLNIKFDDSKEKKGKEAKGQISFSDPTSHLDAYSSVNHVSSQRSISQQTALFTIIRDVILKEKG